MPTDAVAVVMGDIDLVRPLVLAGIPVAAFAAPADPIHWSRHVRAHVSWTDPWESPREAVDALLAFARRQPARPVLLPQSDPDLLLVSRHRDQLEQSYAFLLAAPDVVEALTDKVRFIELAERVGLPVPPTHLLRPAEAGPEDVALRFPLVLKPAVRRGTRWTPIEQEAKASHVASPKELAALWPKLAALDLDVVAQEAVPGTEARIESHHAYVDSGGSVVAEFTGRKIRTRPSRYGHTTALEITAEPDVAALGREALSRVGLTGMAKIDFKRGPDGTLHLLEINPRCTLWHHPGARAGVNLPALMYADLTGGARPPLGRVRPGVRWCLPIRDLKSAREGGASMRAWTRWAVGCEAMSGLAWDDPMPFFGGTVLAGARRRAPRGRRFGAALESA